jgi:hypothetical protein
MSIQITGLTNDQCGISILSFGGLRMYPAQQQVRTQAVYFVVRLTIEFPRIENRDSVEEFKERLGMSIERRGRIGSKLLFRIE